MSFIGTNEQHVWRSRREESDRVVSFARHPRRFLLSSLCVLGLLCFLFLAASLARYGWVLPAALAANTSGPLQVAWRGVSDTEQSPRAAAQSGVASEQFEPGSQALRFASSTAEAGADSERLAYKIEAPPPSPEGPPAPNAIVQVRVLSELFEKVKRPALANTEARPPANSAALGKREELPLPRAEEQSPSEVEEPPAPHTAAASPPNAMAQEGASSEHVRESEGLPSPTPPALSLSNAVAQQKAPSEQLIRPVEEPTATPPAVPPTAEGHGPAPTKVAAYIAQAHAKIQQGDIAAARRLLERASSGDEAEAWLVLAETYDPQMLARWGVVGIKPDLEKAKTLYQEAQRRGAQGAREHLLSLSTVGSPQ